MNGDKARSGGRASKIKERSKMVDGYDEYKKAEKARLTELVKAAAAERKKKELADDLASVGEIVSGEIKNYDDGKGGAWMDDSKEARDKRAAWEHKVIAALYS